jgi:hypothetical protein
MKHAVIYPGMFLLALDAVNLLILRDALAVWNGPSDQETESKQVEARVKLGRAAELWLALDEAAKAG